MLMNTGAALGPNRVGMTRGDAWAALGLCVLALAIRCLGAQGRPVEYDELYHMLAGRSWAAGHGVAIGAGEYVRVRLFSEAVGLSIRLFGWSPLAARLPAILAGAASVGVVFAWVRSAASRRAAWIAALMLCFSHPAIDLAQIARFYTWHVLAVWVLFTQAYALAEHWGVETTARRGGRMLLAAAAAALAAYIQPTTFIALAALAAALVALRVQGSGLRERERWIGVGLALLMALLLAVPVLRAAVAAGWREYRYVAPWAEAAGARPTFYYGILADEYGWLAHLLPLASLLAWRAWPRPALFCATVFAVALALQSFGGMKSPRYISYLEPAFFVLWGLALDASAGPLAAAIAAPFRSLPARAGTVARAAAALAVGYAALIGLPTFRATAAQAIRLAHGQTVLAGPDAPDNEDVDWRPYLPLLRRVSAGATLVTADDLRALYYLGGYDLLLNRTMMQDEQRPEFGVDSRTGGHGLTAPRSLALVMACYPRGAILVSNRRWRSQDITNEVADLIERTARPVALPGALHARAFIWRSAGDDAPACRALRARIGDARGAGGGRLVRL